MTHKMQLKITDRETLGTWSSKPKSPTEPGALTSRVFRLPDGTVVPVGNAWQNHQSLMQARKKAEMQAQAGRLPEFEVDQNRQRELAAKDDWIRATDAAWMRGEAAANRGALLAELISSSIGQFLDDGGHVISCSDLWHLVKSPIDEGQAPQETFRTWAFAERPREFPGAAPVRLNHDTIGRWT